MKKLSTLLIAVLVAAGLLRMCVYTVNERGTLLSSPSANSRP